METNPGDGWLSSRFRGLGRAQLRAIMTRVRDTNSPRNLRSNNALFLPKVPLDCVLRWMALAKLLAPCEYQFHEPILAGSPRAVFYQVDGEEKNPFANECWMWSRKTGPPKSPRAVFYQADGEEKNPVAELQTSVGCRVVKNRPTK
ncbi:hypothetical protein CEXT_389831 [Caerostris extrusa]|uniref:Uncharacterized protein n=1 Tax=Caerostris extrusa TaxID=172846 RepID=A0AAV4V8K6_CAEEX|nr:hypothetical protein CEXT_389831 [Caerostris extrusa]